MSHTTAETQLFEETYSLLVRLASEVVVEDLALDQRLLIAEAFEEFTDAGAETIEALFPLPRPAMSTVDLIARTVHDLEQMVAQSCDLSRALRFTRALDLMRAVRDVDGGRRS